MSVILPSRLSWALSDRPARSKGMWYGILGAFVAGIAVASVAGNIPKVAEDPSITPDKAPVVAKVAVPKTGAQTASSSKPAVKAAPTNATLPGSASAARPEVPVAAPISSTQIASSAAPEKPASGVPVNDRPANDQAVRVIGADRITPPPGATDAAPATTPAPLVIETPPASAAQMDVAPATSQAPKPDAIIIADAPAQPVGMVPMPRNKPASLIADAAAEARPTEVPNHEVRRETVAAVAAADPAVEASRDSPALITGLIPVPRSKPTIPMPAVVAARETEEDDRVSLFGRAADDENARTRRAERRASDRRAAIDDRRQADISRRETRRSERAAELAAERTANERTREVRRRNEDEGFELVRSYRGPDGRRVSVYQRVEQRAAAYQQARPLFGRPAFMMPREFWR